MAFIILIPFGAIMLALPLSINSKIAKIDSDWHPDTLVIFWAKFWSVILSVPFDLFLAILYNEGASKSRYLTDKEIDALGVDRNAQNVGYPVGDIGILRGPSVGPGQVLRTNVERLWNALPDSTRFLYTAPSPQSLAIKGYERQALWVAAMMIAEVLKQADGDKQNAAQRYNGGGGRLVDGVRVTDPRAIAYGEKAQASIERQG